MTMRSLTDLPAEILLTIFAAASAPNTVGRYPRFDSRQHYSRLGRVCRQFHSLTKPILWREIHVENPETLRLFYEAVSNQERNNGILVKKFTFTYDADKFGDDYRQWTTRSINSNESYMNVQDLLQHIFERLRQLQKLGMYKTNGLMNRFHRELEWSFNLYCDETLQEITIRDYLCSPETVDEFFAMRNLQTLFLVDSISEKTWSSKAPSIQTNLKNLSLTGRHASLSGFEGIVQLSKLDGIPNWALKGIFSCCNTVEELDITVTVSSCNNSELDNILAELNGRSRIRRLRLSSHEELESKLLFRFSSWQYLRYLSLHSTILWPIRDSWEIRCELYRNLPPTLTSLRIRFPNAIRSLYRSAPYDGIFQLNVNEDHENAYQYRYQVIPQYRYTWLLNLLKDYKDEAGHVLPYLPCLQNIHLTEDSGVGNNTIYWGRGVEPFPLADEMARRFVERSIKLDIYAITYTNLPDYNTRDPVSEPPGCYGTDDESEGSEASGADEVEQNSSHSLLPTPERQRGRQVQRVRRGRGRT